MKQLSKNANKVRPRGLLTSGPYFVIVCTDEKWYNLLQEQSIKKFWRGSDVSCREKKPVYNGYEERYATGEELSKLFEGQYMTTGRHHSVVLGLSIPDYLWFLGVDDQRIYRIFINQFFCRLMKDDTDGLISFFGHTVLTM